MCSKAKETVLQYPIPHNAKGGTLLVYGAANAPHLIIVCAGFPNDHSIFQPLAKRIVASNPNQYLVGVASLPGYDQEESVAFKQAPDGYTFDEWVRCLRQAVAALAKYSTLPHSKTKLTGIFHDWGALAGHMYTNQVLKDSLPELIPDQVVFLDILLGPHPKTTDKPAGSPMSPWSRLYGALGVLFYQLVLCHAWIIYRYMSKYLAVFFLSILCALSEMLRLNPASWDDWSYMLPRNVPHAFQTLYMTYPYFKAWTAIFTGRIRQAFGGACLPLDLNRTPVLFLYGAAKKFGLHDLQAEALLQREAAQGRRSRVIGIEGAGHWLYMQKEEESYQEIRKFLEELVPLSSSTSSSSR